MNRISSLDQINKPGSIKNKGKLSTQNLMNKSSSQRKLDLIQSWFGGVKSVSVPVSGRQSVTDFGQK